MNGSSIHWVKAIPKSMYVSSIGVSHNELAALVAERG